MNIPSHINHDPAAGTPKHPFVLMFAISFGMAFVFAITYVIVMTLTLPETDGAYGTMPFSHPLVFPVMATIASLAALMVAMPFYFTCRSIPLGRSLAIIVSVTLAEIVVVTPLNMVASFVGSFVAFFVGLWAARRFPDRSGLSIGGN